jgi:hypothetical protein
VPRTKTLRATRLVIPETLDDESLELEGKRIRIDRFRGGECPNSAIRYIPSLRALFSGVLDAMEGCLDDFEAAVAVGEAEAAIGAMITRYPSYDLERWLREYSVPTYLPGKVRDAGIET